MRTYRDKGWATLWAGVTTGVGFGSLLSSSMPPVRATGLWLAFGTGVMTVALFTLLPALLREFCASPSGRQAPPFEKRAGRWGRALAEIAVHRRGRVLTAFAFVALVALAGAVRLRVESNLLTYFGAEHPVRRDFEDLQRRGLAATAADLVLDVGSPPAVPARITDLRAPEQRQRLGQLAAKLRTDPMVFGVLSPADLSPAGSRPSAAAPSEPDFLATGRTLLESADGARARVRLLTPLLGIVPMGELFERIERLARVDFPQAHVWLTGRYPLVVQAQRSLVGTLAASLALTLLCIAAVFRQLLGSLRLTLLALIPNLWPVVGALGAMGWLGVPLEGPTVMIAAVSFGLAVDDTLHFVGDLRGLAPPRAAAEAAVLTQQRIAGAQLLTSIVLAAGFSACALSSFVPVARFAALTVLAVALALAADLLLLPALFARASREQLERLGRRGRPTGARWR